MVIHVTSGEASLVPKLQFGNVLTQKLRFGQSPKQSLWSKSVPKLSLDTSHPRYVGNTQILIYYETRILRYGCAYSGCGRLRRCRFIGVYGRPAIVAI
jgi:hypothetical protein